MLLILSLNKTLLQNLLKCCLSGFLCSVFLIQAQTGPYPNKQIKVVVSFTAGGTSDILAREVSTQLSQRFNVPVIIENKPGAAGNLGTEIVGKSAPDGYTLLVNSIGPIAINPTLFKSLPVNPQKELEPIALLAEVPTVLVVYPGLGVNTAAELIEYSKARPNQMNYSSTGIGTASHMTGFLFSQKNGISTTHIPYKGAEAVRDLIAGRVQFMFATLPSVSSLIKGGQLKAIAISSKKRYVTLPEVPTLAENGIPIITGSWFGVFAPKNTPPEILKKLNENIVDIVMSKKTNEKLINEGAEPIAMNLAEFSKFVKTEYETWAPIVRASGAKPE